MGAAADGGGLLPPPLMPTDAPVPPPALTAPQDLLCGAAAGMCARMVVALLDLVKIRFQVQSVHAYAAPYRTVWGSLRGVAAREGLRALWNGNVPALLMVTPYVAIQLALFYETRPVAAVRAPEPYATLFAGAAAAAAATIATYPLDLLRTRAAAAASDTAAAPSAPHVVRTAGIAGLYDGLRPTLVQIVPYMALNLLLYEAVNARAAAAASRPHGQPPPVTKTLVVAAAVGTASKLATLPLDNSKKILQVQAQFGARRFAGIRAVLAHLRAPHGVRAWFRGALPSVVKVAHNSDVTFVVYEAAKRFVVRRTAMNARDNNIENNHSIKQTPQRIINSTYCIFTYGSAKEGSERGV